MLFELPPLPAKVPAGMIPEWGIQNAKHRPCPVCSSDAPVPFVARPDKFVVHHCSACGMRYLADIPSQDELEKFYRSYSIYKNYRFAKLSLWNKITGSGNPFITILQNTGGVSGLSICEIGCSDGFFLELLRSRGADVYGVELDADCDHILEKKNVPHSKSIPAGQLYDAFCLFQILEHLSHPEDMIKNIAGSIKKDGRLLISVPNGGEVAKAGPTWIGFRVDLEHLNYFDLSSLSNLLSRQGMLVEQYWEHNQPGIQRPNPSKSPPILRSTNWRRLSGFLYRHPLSAQGSFVLTVLSRKVR